MKTLIAACIIILSSFQINYSQFISNIGVKAGATFSNQDFRDSSGYMFWENDNNIGFNGSVFMEFLSTKNFNMVLDAGFERRGYAFEVVRTDEFGNEIGRYNVHNNTHYASIALLGKIKFPGNKISSYYIAGPRFDAYLGYNIASEDDSWNAVENDALEDFKKYNYGITIGAGLELSFVKRFRPFIEANYSPKIAESYNHRGFNIKEHYFNIKAGIYIFDFGKKKK